MIHLYFADNNSPLWLVGILLMVIGAFSCAIPNGMINLELGKMDVNAARWVGILKYSAFMIMNLFFIRYKSITVVTIIGLFIIDSIFEVKLMREINKANIAAKVFWVKLRESDTEKIERVMKYIMGNMLVLILILSTHENIKEFIIMMLICLIVCFFTLEKILSNIEDIEKKTIWKCRVCLWSLEVLTILSVYLDLHMVTHWIASYILYGNY